jgi:hypothetical protein
MVKKSIESNVDFIVMMVEINFTYSTLSMTQVLEPVMIVSTNNFFDTLTIHYKVYLTFFYWSLNLILYFKSSLLFFCRKPDYHLPLYLKQWLKWRTKNVKDTTTFLSR